MEYILRTEALTKQYDKRNAISNVDIAVRLGAVYGLVGQNGAGKTTILKIIGRNEEPGIYPDMSARQNLKLKCLAMGIKSKDHIDELLDFVGLANVGKKSAKKYSLGMKQRLGIALALVGYPELVILDEPINGLDPQGIVEFRKMIARLNSERKITFIISSHILGELSKIATD